MSGSARLVRPPAADHDGNLRGAADRDGFPVASVTAHAWQRARARPVSSPTFVACFLPGDRPPGAGQRVVLDNHGTFLEAIADSYGETGSPSTPPPPVGALVLAGPGLPRSRNGSIP